MCIFTQPVLTVNNTQIFARLSGNGTQLLAYQMNYESRDQNAMILPIPVKQPAMDNFLKFIDLKNYESFFDDLGAGFPFYAPPSIGCSAPFDPATRSVLEVFEVGNYIASFVPSLANFTRLDPKFTLPTETWDKIPEYREFGFAVFQLAAGSVKPHPMAFEYQSDRDDLFFPTVHIHDGVVHASEKFDHVLYMQHAGFDSKVYSYQNSHIEDESTGLIRSKSTASISCDVDRTLGLVDGDLLLHRKILRGKLPNGDTVIPTYGDPLTATINIRPWLSYTPWLIVLAAIAWFFHRRSKLQKLQESKLGESSCEKAI